MAQETGLGFQTSLTVPPGRFILSTLYAESAEEKSSTYFRTGLTERLEIGLGYAATSHQVIGNLGYSLRPEAPGQPGLVLGLGTTRLGGTDTSVYLLASGALRKTSPDNARAYLGLAAQLGAGGPELIGGLSAPVGPRWRASLQYDAEHIHPALLYQRGPLNLGLFGVPRETFSRYRWGLYVAWNGEF